MTTKRWDFRDEDLRRYAVEVEHAVLSGDRRIVVNGREVFHGGKFFDTGSEHAFDVEGHSARLRIGSNGFGYTYHLVVDGLTIPPEGATIPRPPRTAPVDVPPAYAPDRAAAAQPVVAALAQAPDLAALARAGLVQRVRNGGRWFYWIAVAHVVVIALFAFLGVRATAGAQWAFIVGGLLYALDGLLFLLVGGWIGIAVHAFALFSIVSATISLRRLHSTPATTLQTA